MKRFKSYVLPALGIFAPTTFLFAAPTEFGLWIASLSESGSLTGTHTLYTLDSGVSKKMTTVVATANTPSSLVARDGSGNFSAGTIIASLTGNASTATALASNPADCSSGQYATTIAANGTLTCAQVDYLQVSGLGTLATQSGTFSGTSSGTNTGDQTTITGNAGTATALAANPSDCSSNQYANAIAASGDLTCSSLVDADVPNTITVDLATTTTALAANGSNCSAGNYPLGVNASGAAESCTADDDIPDDDSEVPDALTISGGTVNNSVIGGTTPAAGTFTTVTASGNISTTGGKVMIGAGSPSYPLHITSANTGTLVALAPGSASNFSDLIGGGWPVMTGDVQGTFFSGQVTGTISDVISNTAVSAAGANAFYKARTTPTGGDPGVVLTVGGVESWNIYVDNSDADKLKIGTSVDPFPAGITDYLSIDAANGGVLSMVTELDIVRDNVAGASAKAINIVGSLGIMNGVDDYTAVDINIANADHTGAANTVQAISIASLTGDADATETAIKIGSGWDAGIDLSSNSIIGVRDAEIESRYRFKTATSTASANNLVLPADGDTIPITGTTQINLIRSTNIISGDRFVLKFASAGCTVKHGQVASGVNKTIKNTASADYVSTAGSELHVMFDGTDFYTTPGYYP